LQYQLPPDPSETIRDRKLFVFHEAIAQIDVQMASDPVFKFDIPVIPILPAGSEFSNAGTFENNSVQLSLDQLYGHTGDTIPFSLNIPADVKHRSIRVEMVQRIDRRVRNRSDRSQRKFKIFETDAGNPLPTAIHLPQLPFSTIFGVNFQISYTMKFTIDIAWASDINVESAFAYFTVPRHIFADQASETTEIKPRHEMDIKQSTDQFEFEEVEDPKSAKALDLVEDDLSAYACKVCGHELIEGSAFCDSCGTKA
jgi:hypothetical protein